VDPGPVTTRPDGGFRWTDPRASTLLRVNSVFLVRARGFIDHHAFLTAKQIETLKAGRPVGPLEIVLVPPATVEGRIIDAEGRPGAGVTVALTARPLDRYPNDHLRAQTDEDGTFRFTDVDPRRAAWIVAWRHANGEEQRTRATALPLLSGQDSPTWRELFLRSAENVELTVALPTVSEGTKVIVAGKEHRPDRGILRTTVRTGPNRVTLKDVSCSTISEHDVEIPPGYRAFEVVLPEVR